MQQAFRRLLSVGLALGTLCACASPPSPKPPVSESKPVHQGPPTDLVPAAGLRWLVVVEPKRLWSIPGVAPSVQRLFATERLDAFAKASGLDLRTLDAGAIAGFDLGTLYLALTRDRIGIAQEAFIDRLISDPVTKHLGPGVTHTTGIIGTTPESFLALDRYGVALSVGDPTLTKIAGAFALGKLHKSPSALRGAALRELPKTLDDEPLRFYAPGPFIGEWARGAQGLLAETTAVAIVARPEQNGVLRVAVTALGDYGDDVNAVNRKARQSYEALAQSDLGRLLGFAEPTLSPEVMAESRRVSITLFIPLQRLIDGLYTAVAANVWDMLELAPRAKTTL